MKEEKTEWFGQEEGFNGEMTLHRERKIAQNLIHLFEFVWLWFLLLIYGFDLRMASWRCFHWKNHQCILDLVFGMKELWKASPSIYLLFSPSVCTCKQIDEGKRHHNKRRIKKCSSACDNSQPEIMVWCGSSLIILPLQFCFSPEFDFELVNVVLMPEAWLLSQLFIQLFSDYASYSSDPSGKSEAGSMVWHWAGGALHWVWTVWNCHGHCLVWHQSVTVGMYLPPVQLTRHSFVLWHRVWLELTHLWILLSVCFVSDLVANSLCSLDKVLT